MVSIYLVYIKCMGYSVMHFHVVIVKISSKSKKGVCVSPLRISLSLKYVALLNFLVQSKTIVPSDSFQITTMWKSARVSRCLSHVQFTILLLQHLCFRSDNLLLSSVVIILFSYCKFASPRQFSSPSREKIAVIMQ